ncbi:Imm1 family immunity protein [Actinokineospora sp. NBRC 105648]|uniref:Imm1 family immunity protein n=1 Tax=Actinokineospora sp. NBRC 105648 TaxID=3032206 RepID=UPI00249FEF77|nr:Imm1 family immunity protein [Actinokineospora sp. NBRC 105648]GLZ43313.1 hypothetical protein Acsp05_69370 [Actinokineospora sp. NBRC 105648]
MTTPITHNGYIAMDAMRPGEDLLAEVRDLNTAGVRIPWAWTLTETVLDPYSRDQAALTFGINNDRGALTWEQGEHAFVPTTGSNTEWLTYHFAGMEETGIPPHGEVPIDTVYTALGEFLRTRVRPTCVEWQEAAPEFE